MNRYLAIFIFASIVVLLATACKTDKVLSNESSLGKDDLNQKRAIEEKTDIPIDETHFPGDLFREFIGKQYDKNGDGYLSQDEREQVTKIKMVSITAMHFQHIGEDSDSWKWYEVWTEEGEEDLDITGIHYFINLENVYLDDWNSLIGEEEIEQLSVLKTLSLRCGGWEKLIQPHMKSLEKLEVQGLDLIKKLDVRFLPNIKHIDIMGAMWMGKVNPKEVVREQLDISANRKLEVLDCSGLGLKQLNLSNNPKLRKLNCNDNQLKRLELSQNSQLKELQCDNNWLKKLDTSRLKKLNSLYCCENQLKQLNLPQNKVLRILYVDKNKLKNLDISQNKKLRVMSCRWNQLTNLNVNNNLDLESIDCTDNQIKKLDVSLLKNLYGLDCRKNQIKKLSLKKNKQLNDLDCSENKITFLNLLKNKKLNRLYIEENQIKKIILAPKALRWTLNNELYYDNASGNMIQTLDIRSAKSFGKKGRTCVQYWITGGYKMHRVKKITMKTIILNKNLPKQDKQLVEKMGKKFHLNLQYV